MHPNSPLPAGDRGGRLLSGKRAYILSLSHVNPRVFFPSSCSELQWTKCNFVNLSISRIDIREMDARSSTYLQTCICSRLNCSEGSRMGAFNPISWYVRRATSVYKAQLVRNTLANGIGTFRRRTALHLLYVAYTFIFVMNFVCNLIVCCPFMTHCHLRIVS